MFLQAHSPITVDIVPGASLKNFRKPVGRASKNDGIFSRCDCVENLVITVNTQFTSLPTNKTPLLVYEIPLILQIKYMKICTALGLSVYSFLRIWLCELVCVHAVFRGPQLKANTLQRSPAPVTTGCFPPSVGFQRGGFCPATQKRPFYFTGQISLYQSGSIQLRSACWETCTRHGAYQRDLLVCLQDKVK